MCISGDLTSLLTVTIPESRRYNPHFTDEKDEAQGQNLTKVLESVNDETRLRLKFGPSIVCLTGGWSVCMKSAQNMLLRDAFTPKIRKYSQAGA